MRILNSNVYKILLLLLILTACQTGYNKNNCNDTFTDTEQFVVQDSLISDFEYYQRKVYFGHTKAENDTSRWIDLIKIYHISNLCDTNLVITFPFYRKEWEGGNYLKENEQNSLEFIFVTIAGNAAYSENYFEFLPESESYVYLKRCYHTKKENIWEEYSIPLSINIDKIDSLTINHLFTIEENYDNL